MNRFVRSVLLSCWLGFGVFASGCQTQVRIPLPPTPCTIPAFHVQASCQKPDGQDDIACLLTEFAATVAAEKQVADALKTCPEVKVR